MIYRYKNHKIIYILLILISIFFFIVNYVLLLEYKNIINIILMIIFGIAPFFISFFLHSNEKLKYQIIMSIIYNKYIEENNGYLDAILHYNFDEVIETKKIYDELFEKMTNKDWQDAIKKFYRLKKDFDTARLKEIEIEKYNQEVEFRSKLIDSKETFKNHLKDNK